MWKETHPIDINKMNIDCDSFIASNSINGLSNFDVALLDYAISYSQKCYCIVVVSIAVEPHNTCTVSSLELTDDIRSRGW